jgi:endonuclease YncB( thermonuclease family)
MRPEVVMAKNLLRGALVVAGVVFLGALESSPLQARDAQTKVILNGKPAPVFFNDGDSFRVLGGTFKSAKARLFGYNTLESHGAVHQWGSWTLEELYTVAKMATLFARKGVWECDSDGKTDTYGRMLTWCPDLADAMVRNGYAHVMTVDDQPGDPKLLEAQREAIENRRGLWSHGVPDFVVTSLHSVEEDVDGKGTYNRLVSTADGHSVKWRHSTRYTECQRVCHMVYEVDEAKVEALAAALAQDGAAAKLVGSLSDDDLESLARDFIRYRHINRTVAPEDREKLADHLDRNYVRQGVLGTPSASEGSCMVHVDFKRRYGEGRAGCLK